MISPFGHNSFHHDGVGDGSYSCTKIATKITKNVEAFYRINRKKSRQNQGTLTKRTIRQTDSDAIYRDLSGYLR